MTHIFDLDNTLVYTDRANCDAYNEALRREGLEPITAAGRITRETVRFAYPEMADVQLQRIITGKQALFSPKKTVLNVPLLEYAKEQGRDRCLIWSSADYGRACSLMVYHNLKAHFFDVYFSPKTDIPRELELLVRRFLLNPGNLVVYEDTEGHIEELRKMGIRVIDANALGAYGVKPGPRPNWYSV